MRGRCFLLLMLCFFIFRADCLASSYDTIKLAVFDNPQPDISLAESSQTLINAYFSGINTATKTAANEGINIDEKYFFHTGNVLEIMRKANDLKTWDPSVIIGSHASNDFLMAKTFFGDQLILSIAATDPKLSILPNNFYSLGIPDPKAVKPITNFINQHYPKADLFIAVGAESKESVDWAELLGRTYEKEYHPLKIMERQFLTEDMSTLDMKKFMVGYQPGDVIVLVPSGYHSGIQVMNKITHYLNPIKPTFILASDNWGDDDTPQLVEGISDAFRVDFLSGGKNTKEYKIFAENYQKIYQSPPKDAISFVTYRTVMSFVTALKDYPPPKNLTTTQAILWSYQEALKHDPNWFRSTQYIVYKLSSTKEIYYQTLQQPKD